MGLLNRRSAPQLIGLAATPDGLYDGSFICACATAWNELVEARKGLGQAGYQPLRPDALARLVQVPQPDSRRLFEAVASLVSMPGRQSSAVLALAYAMAVVFEAGAGRGEPDAASRTRARQMTADDFEELHLHFSQEGRAKEFDQWLPYWEQAKTLLDERVADRIVNALAYAFDDQVDRWSAAEGFDLRRSIGEPDWALTRANVDDLRLPNFVELLWDWGGRLCLGERLIAEGFDLRDLRFTRDEFDPMEHFYDEAFGRYHEIASKDEPDNEDVVLAARLLVAWIGEELDGKQQLALSTTAIRGYIYRSVENGPVDFLEPELSQAVEASRTIGDDRSPDEPFGVTLFYAASQCVEDGVKTRLGSVGGLIQGPRFYERAFWDTTADFEDLGFTLDEGKRRTAFMFGVCLADVERLLR